MPPVSWVQTSWRRSISETRAWWIRPTTGSSWQNCFRNTGWTGGHGKRAGHPDHLAAGQIAMNAVNYASLVKAPTNSEVHRVPALYHFFLPPGVMPTFVVDITDQYDRWLKALKAHASQFQNPKKPKDYIWTLETLARYYGALIGVKYGQGFIIGEPMHIDDPMKLLPGSN